MIYSITPKLLEGQKCLVMNYRKKFKQYEMGTVQQVDANLRQDGTFRLTYRVLLDRKSIGKRGWRQVIILTVGDDKIEPIR